MSGDFGFQREKRVLAKLVQAQDATKLQSFVEKLVFAHGAEKVTGWVVNEVLPLVDPDSMAWAYEFMLGEEGYARMQKKALEAVSETLVQKGYAPGRDFSVHPNGGFILSSESSEALLQDIPEQYRERVRADVLQTEERLDAQTALEKYLGVPFVDNLLGRVETRIPRLTNTQVATYLVTIGVGVEQRTQIELFPKLVRHLQQRFPERFQAVWEIIKSGCGDETESAWGIDLVIAAGGESELMPDPERPGNYFINRRGLQILATVYQGERSVYELIAALDAQQRLVGDDC